MWNINVKFNATLARPKPGVRFDNGNEFATDVEEAVRDVNLQWNGDRIFDIVGYDGITVKMVYRALDPIHGKRTITRYLQEISQILAYQKLWNDRVTRKKGAIFTVDIIGSPDDEMVNFNVNKGNKVLEDMTVKDLLKQVLEVLIDIREEIKK